MMTHYGRTPRGAFEKCRHSRIGVATLDFPKNRVFSGRDEMDTFLVTTCARYIVGATSTPHMKGHYMAVILVKGALGYDEAIRAR